MGKFLSWVGSACFFMGPCLGHAHIHTVSSMDQALSLMGPALKKEKAEDVLIAFDIDMTLTQPDHPAVYYPHLLKYVKDYKEVMKDLPEDKKELPNMFVLNLPQRLVEAQTPGIIQNLQTQGFKVIAFTASLTGKIGNYDRFEIKRYEDLKKAGLSFEEQWKDYPDLRLNDCTPYRGTYPIFYRGILCSNGEKSQNSKGTVLLSFLKHVKMSPKIIVMIDDKKKNLEDIEEALKNEDSSIEFVGIEYQGALHYAPKDISKEDFKAFWQDLVFQTQREK